MKDPHPGNMGDIITPIIINKLFKVKCRWVDRKRQAPHFIMTGSILKFTSKHTTVWGSGAMWENEKPSSEAEYLSVRGPISYELVKANGGKVEDIFGDPAMLLPLFHPNRQEKKYKIGILPHYVDFKAVSARYRNRPDIIVIDILNINPLLVVDQMLQCEKIVTSSLHGVIVANAYGIPVSPVKFSNLLVGDGTKFKDHLLSVGISQFNMTELNKPLTFDQLNSLPYITGTQFDGSRMIEALNKKIRG